MTKSYLYLPIFCFQTAFYKKGRLKRSMFTYPAASIAWRHICCLPRRHGGSSGRLFSDGPRLHILASRR